MKEYKYVGRKMNGQEVTGRMFAIDKQEVVENLRETKVYPIKISPIGLGSTDISLNVLKKRVTSKDISVFARQFSSIISSGISLIECLDILRKQTENKKMKDAIENIYQDVQKGSNMSRAMEKQTEVFPDLLINMVKAGEMTGNLDEIMAKMADHYEKENKIKMKIRGALIYPIILITVAVVVSVILLVFVLPTFMEMFDSFGVPLPVFTRVLIATGNFMREFWYLLFGGFILGIYLLKRYIDSNEGRIKFDRFKLNAPVIGNVNQKVATSRFASSLAAMLSSGITIIEAVEIVKEIISNRHIEQKLNTSLDKIRKGEPIYKSISNVQVFPPMLISMVRIGEETGSIDELLYTVSNFYDDEVDSAIAGMIELINPIILFFMAIVVGSILLAVALPMFDMYNYLEF